MAVLTDSCKKGILLWACLFCFLSGFSQKQEVADSLKALLTPELSDVQERDLLENIIRHEQNQDSAFKYGSRYLELSKKTNYRKGLSIGYVAMGGSYYQQGELDKALEFYLLSLQHTDDEHRKAIAYSDMGNIYQINEDFPNCFKNYYKATEIYSRLNDSLRLAGTCVSIGYAYYLNDRLDSATITLTKAVEIFKRLNHKHRAYYLAYAEGNLALVLAKQGRLNEGETSLKKVISILEEYKDEYAISEYKIELGKIYLDTKDASRGLALVVAGTEMAMKNDFKKFIRNGSKILAQYYQKSGNYKKAFEYQAQFMAYNDSLENADVVRKMASQRTEFEVGQKQIEVDLLNQQKKNQQIIQISTLIISSLVILGLSFSFWQKRQSNLQLQAKQVIIAERNDQLQEVNASKDKLFSIIGHDLKGPLNALNMFSKLLSTHTDQFSKDEIKKLAVDLNMSVKNLYKLLENLLAWGRSQIGAIDFTPEQFDITAVLKENQNLLKGQAEDKKITIVNEIALSLPVHAHHNTIDTVVRNLLSNAIKFTPEGGTIKLSAEQADGFVRVSVADTGIGIKKTSIAGLFKVGTHHNTEGTAQEKGTGLGLMLCKDFVERNGGTIGVESIEGKGSTFYFTVPMAS